MLLSDGYLANGSEPWRIPEVDDLPAIDPAFATEHQPRDRRQGRRDPRRLLALPARRGHPRAAVGGPRHPGPRAPHRRPGEGRRARQHLLRPGQPRLHGPHPPGQGRPDRRLAAAARGRRPLRAGHACSCSAGARRTARSAPPAAGSARPGSTSPRRTCATSTRSRTTSARSSSGYDAVMVPEMNLGQLSLLLRAKYLVDVVGYNHVRGLPLKAAELAEAITDLITATTGQETPREPVPRPTSRARRPSRDHRRTPLPRPRRASPTLAAGRGQADRQGLHLRPGGALVPRLRRLRRAQGRAVASCPTSGCAGRTSSSSPASAAPRGSPTTSTPTGCTPSTAARPRSPPASRPRARTCRCGSSPVTATRSRSAATT